MDFVDAVCVLQLLQYAASSPASSSSSVKAFKQSAIEHVPLFPDPFPKERPNFFSRICALFGIGNDKSQKGSYAIDFFPHVLHVVVLVIHHTYSIINLCELETRESDVC
jgi:hypothetical protein